MTFIITTEPNNKAKPFFSRAPWPERAVNLWFLDGLEVEKHVMDLMCTFMLPDTRNTHHIGKINVNPLKEPSDLA